MKRRTVLVTAAASLVALGLLAWAFMPRPVEVEVARATRGHFETTLDEDARTRLAERYVVSAPLAGRLQRIVMREGDAVQAGDALATLMPVLAPLLDERTLREQAARVGAADATWRQARTRIGVAQVALERARSDWRRTEQLAQQGFVASTKIDGDRLAAEAAQKDLEAAAEGEQVARHGLTLARAALVAVQGGRPTGGFVLRAPVAGRVLKLHHTSETTVALGAPLVEIGDTRHLEIVAELLTSDALQTQPGSAVRIERWGGPVVLQGQVRRVEPAAFTKISALGVEEQRVNVIIAITSPPADWAALGDGYRVAVRIVLLSRDQVLQVPVSAVFPRPGADGPTTQHAVFVLAEGRARLQAVTVAARNGHQAWVSEGLAPDSQVIVYPPAAVADGVRVRVAPAGVG